MLGLFTNSKLTQRLGLASTVVVASVVLAACSNTQPATPTPAPAASPAAVIQTSPSPVVSASPSAVETMDAGEVKIVNVEAGSFYYKPNEIRVKKGEKVKIVMKSVSMMHDFTIDALKVKVPITQAGQTGTVEFTADQVGTFEYYCSVGNHKAQGQVGKLIVE